MNINWQEACIFTNIIFICFPIVIKVSNLSSLFFHILCLRVVILIRFCHHVIFVADLFPLIMPEKLLCTATDVNLFLPSVNPRLSPWGRIFKASLMQPESYSCIGFLFISMATGTTPIYSFFVDFHNPLMCKNDSHAEVKQYIKPGRIRA